MDNPSNFIKIRRISTDFIAKPTDYNGFGRKPTEQSNSKSERYMLLGNKIKELRNKHEVLQRQLASYLEIDTPMFSKIERGDRRAKRSQVVLVCSA